MLFRLVFIMALLLSNDASAKAHHEGTVSSINIGTRFSSLLQRRGVIFYKDYQFDPVFAVFFLDDRVEYLGDSIGFRDFVYGDRVRFRTRLLQQSDNALFPENKTIADAAPKRHNTYEWANGVELFFPGYSEKYQGELDLTFYKDLNQHHGHFFEAQGKLKLARWSRFEPNLVVNTGIGDAAHNRYLYGDSARANGVSTFGYGVWVAFPEDADRFYPIVQLMHFSTVGSNRQAEYAKGRSDGVLLSFIATFGALEAWRN